jgi:hypothetical protein
MVAVSEANYAILLPTMSMVLLSFTPSRNILQSLQK